MSDRWPRGWQETASAWKLSPEALLWAYELRRAVQERDFPLFPSPAGWSQFLELEYKQRAWAAGDEGRAYFNACSEIEETVRRDLVPSLTDIAARIPPSALASLREKRHRLLTIPNPNLRWRIIGTNPPDVVLFSLRIFAIEPMRSVLSFWVDSWIAQVCIQATLQRIMADPYKNAVLMLNVGVGSPSEQSRHFETVRGRLLPAAEHIRGADLVVDDVLLAYVFEKELGENNTRDAYVFNEKLLEGRVASEHGFKCDVKNEVKKWRWRFASWADNTDAPDPFEDEESVLDKITFGENGRLLDQATSTLDRVACKGASEIIRTRYAYPELTNEELAEATGTDLMKVRRTHRRTRARRTAFTRRFDLSPPTASQRKVTS